MKITPTSLSVSQLLGQSSEQYVIPTYQRRYSWRERQIWELIDDIKLIEGNDTHLLGSIVCLTGHHTAGVNKLELVDGQQRLTTISILLECIRQRLEAEGQDDDAKEAYRLLVAKPHEGKPVKKIALDSIDSAEFDQLVKNETGEPCKNANLELAFSVVRKWVADQSVKSLAKFLYHLTNQAIIIRLDVGEAKDAFKLFETINNRGLQLSPTDIIKNFLLGNAARFGDEHLENARKSWTLLIQHLDGTGSDAFFRYYLMTMLKTRLTASEVVPGFKKVFMSQVTEAAALPERHLYLDLDESEDDEEEDESKDNILEIEISDKVPLRTFLSKLVENAKIYGEIVLVKAKDQAINRHFRNLKMIKAVQTYGFLMHLRVGGCPEKQFLEVLRLTESFVLRRHVCKERSNETEALFARLCSVPPTAPVQKTKDAYRDLCPSDEKFRYEFSATNFTSNVLNRARYCLEQIEQRKHGAYDEIQVLGAEDVHVEHIIPQKIKTKKAKREFGDWVEYLGERAESKHEKYVSRIGNLTLFAGSLNIVASNHPFQSKKRAYKESSIKLTQELSKLSNFKFPNVDSRSKELADIACELWPIP